MHKNEDQPLHEQLLSALLGFRQQKNFHPSNTLKAKLCLLNEYCQHFNIATCVVGISGGVDSAVTLGILKQLLHLPNAALKRVIPVFIPMYLKEGVSNQAEAFKRALHLTQALELELKVVDLSNAYQVMRRSIENSIGYSGNAWAAGQLVSNIRVPVLYHIATLLFQYEFKCIVSGTINKDEYSYIGYYGKASDAMVDIQPISDLHKSEVYALAELLSIPQEIIAAEPTGDTFDGKTDRENIGASYDFIELYSYYLALKSTPRKNFLTQLCEAAHLEFNYCAKKLDTLHAINKHKYLVGSPAVHFNLMDTNEVRDTILKNENININNPFKLNKSIHKKLSEHCADISSQPIDHFGEAAILINKLLSPKEASILQQEFMQQQFIPVGVNGYTRAKPETEPTGSYRASTFDKKLSKLLWNKLKLYIDNIKIIDEHSYIDLHHIGTVWRPIGVNPLFRIIKYLSGGYLIPHYDSAFDYQDKTRYTLKSLIIFLSDCSNNSGLTRLLKEKQLHLPVNKRDFSDRYVSIEAEDIVIEVIPEAGKALIIDHRVPHEVTTYFGHEPRLVMRTDIIYERLRAYVAT